MSFRVFFGLALLTVGCTAAPTSGSGEEAGGSSASGSGGFAGLGGEGPSSSGSSSTSGTGGASGGGVSSGSGGASSGSGGSGGAGPGPGKYDWLQFGFSQDKMANLDFGHSETTIDATNVAKLTQLFQVPLADAPDGAPVALSDVMTPMGVRDLVYVVGQHGLLTAFDGKSGVTVWHVTFAATGYSNSAPAIDPNRQFIYVNTADGMIHKLQVGDGTEIKSTGWPVPNGGGK